MGENGDNQQSGGTPPDMPSGSEGGTPPDMQSGSEGGTPPDMPSGSEGGTPPDMQSGGEGGTPPDMPGGNGGGNSSSSVTWSGATEITSGGTYANQTYTSSTANQNALLVNTSENVTLTNPTVSKTGSGESNDNASFYGTNAGVLVKGGSTTTITGGTVTTSANGANGVFSYGGNGGQNGASGDGTTVVISDVTISTSGDGAGGIMTTGGGVTKASNLTITTTGQSSAPIRTDRGGGNVTVSGGSYTSSGLGSPAIYSTADIVVEDATLTSNLSEGVCIEGQNSVTLNNCTLTANNTRTNGNAQFLDAVILYQSMSGDSASGTATFTMNGGKLVNKSGHVFHVTNTNAVINLNDVTIEDSGSGVLLSVCDDGWSGASNVATLNADGQTLTGDILVGNDSTLTLNLTDSTIFTGNISGNITNNAGSSISTSVGTVNVSLDSSSKWYLDSDVYISSFSGTAANVITNGHTLYVNNSPLSGTTESEETTPATVTTALNIANTVNNTLIQGSDYNDTITNSGSNVTIQAQGGDDIITVGSEQVLIQYMAGDGSDLIYGFNENSTLSVAGDSYSSTTSGTNLIVTIDDESITLFNAANLDNVHIIGTPAGDDSTSITSGGGSTSTTSGGSSTSTTSGGSSTSTTSGGSSATTTSGGSSTSTTSGGSSTSTTSGGTSTSTTSGGTSTSTTSGGSSTSTTSGGSSTSTTSGGSSTSITNGGTLTSTVRSTGNAGLDRLLGISTPTTSSGSETDTTDENSETSTTDESETSAPVATSSEVSYIYTGGNMIIDNYESGEKIALGTYPTGGTFVDGNFVLSSDSGNLVIQDATDKVIEFVDGAGNDFIKAYGATNPGVIDGRGIAGFEVITGSAEGTDWIYAGNDGSQLWGGEGSAADLMVGGNGSDIFIGGKNQGADIFSNAETKDAVYLNDAILSDVIATAEKDGLIAISFNTGNAVALQSSEVLSAAIILADGSAWRYNHATKSWQSA